MEDIKSKIKKLLSLATSSNEAEAMLAMTKAQALMNEYRISNLDLELSEHAHIVEHDIDSIGKFDHRWKSHLAAAIANSNHCTILKMKYGTKIFGRSENVMVANAMFDYILSFIKSKKLTGASLKNYGIGFTYSITQKLNETKMSWINDVPHANELVVVYDSEINKYFSDNGIKTKIDSRQTKLSNKDTNNAFKSGMTDGSNFNLSRQLTSNAKRLT